jgi:transcriptional antiterminator RfaH
MPETSQNHWYCFTAQPKREHIAAAAIKARVRIDAFCPRIAYRKRTKKGIVRFVEALFPGYVFVLCDVQQHLRHILSMQGVKSVVKYGDYIPELSVELVDELARHFPEGVREMENPEIRPGQEVMLTEGPFKDLQAIVESYAPANDRIRILLELLGRNVSVETTADKVMLPGYRPGTEI